MKRELFVKIVAGVLAALMVISVLPVIFARADGDMADEIAENMTDEEKITQLLMPAMRYWADENGKLQPLTELNEEFKATLERYGFAGIVFFAQNSADNEKAQKLVRDMQLANAAGGHKTQLLTAIDQEGGSVTRLGHGTQMPGNMALGAAGDTAYTVMAAEVIADELKTLGFNLDFAPVVDVNVNPANPVIGVRSFSDDAETAAEKGVAFMLTLQSGDIIPALKHFPGHGDTATDSHTGLPTVDKSYEELKKTELVPFKECIDAGAEVIMTAHISYPQLEKEKYVTSSGDEITLPATLSKTILTDVLRGDMGYEGVVITDAMNMDAIAKNFGIVEASRLAIEAGADIILMPVNLVSNDGLKELDSYIASLVELLRTGKLSREKVDAAVLRVLRLKEKHGLLEEYKLTNADVSSVGSKEHHDIEWQIAKKAVTLVKNDNGTLPLDTSAGKTIVLTAYNNEVLSIQYAIGLLRDEGKLPENAEIDVISYQKMSAEEMTDAISGAKHVVIVSEMGGTSFLKPDSVSDKIVAVIKAAHDIGADATVMSVQLPYDAAKYEDADAVIIAWSAKGMSEDPRNTENGVSQYGANMPAAMYLILSPDEEPEGKLPVIIPFVNADGTYSEKIKYARGFGLGYTADPIASFTDVSPDAWYADSIRFVLNEGILSGYGNGVFAPNDKTTRAMLVTMLWRLDGEKYINYALSFADVPPEEWYTEAVRWASGEQIVEGYDKNSFGPNDMVSREQAAAILYRWAKLNNLDVSKKADISGFRDYAEVSGWAIEAVSWANEMGIMGGTPDNDLLPQNTASRAELAAMLKRISALKSI